MLERLPVQPDSDLSVQRRWVASRIVFFTGMVFLVVLTIGLALTAFMYWVAHQIGYGLISAFFPSIAPDPWIYIFIYAALAYLAYFVLPVVIFMPILLPLAWTWRTPHRIVVFRRFNTPHESRALRHIAARHLVRFGHVFTLADSQIRRSIFVRIPALLGQLSFMHFRPRRVHEAGSLRKLEHLLEQRWRLNINWLVSFRKIFPTVSSDEWWPACVGTLLERADLVVMDISSFSSSMAWEIAECHRRGLLSRTVLLIARENGERRHAVLAEMAAKVGSGLDQSLFVYQGDDLEQPDAFRQKVAGILAQPGVLHSPASVWPMMLIAATTLGVSLALAGSMLALTAPYLFPELTGRFSPVRSQALTAYRLTGSVETLSRLIADDREWTLGKLRQDAIGSTGHTRRVAVTALRDVGDERDIPILIDLIGAREEDPEALKRLIRWPDLLADSLTSLVKRLGKPALGPLLLAIRDAPRLPYDQGLYQEYVSVQAADFGPAIFEPMLASPSQAGRFIAALQLARRGEPRTIPVLLEILRATGGLGLGLYAGEKVSEFSRSRVRFDPAWLDPIFRGTTPPRIKRRGLQ